jgi:hypothetical protein
MGLVGVGDGVAVVLFGIDPARIVKPQHQPIPPWFSLISEYLEPELPKSSCVHHDYHKRLP